MMILFKIILIILRIFICYKVLSLLSINFIDYDQTTLNKLIWWGVFLMFDMWLQIFLPSSYDKNEKE